MIDMKYIKIYYEIIYIDEEHLVELDISEVNEIGKDNYGKVGYDQMGLAEYIPIDDERNIFKFLLSLRNIGLYDFITSPESVDKLHTGFNDLTKNYIIKILNGYVDNKYPELII